MANINIGGRLHSTATGNVVAGANEILDDVKGKKQSVINQETDEALAGKQAALVSGTNVKTVNGESILGSGNIQAGEPDAIKYSSQTLTDVQKTQARANIGAYNKPETGIPATDLASAAQTSLGKADTAYQKPQSGVPKSDLASGIQDSLELADTAVQAENVGPILPPPETDEFATKTQVAQLEHKVTEIEEGGIAGQDEIDELNRKVGDVSMNVTNLHTAVDTGGHFEGEVGEIPTSVANGWYAEVNIQGGKYYKLRYSQGNKIAYYLLLLDADGKIVIKDAPRDPNYTAYDIAETGFIYAPTNVTKAIIMAQQTSMAKCTAELYEAVYNDLENRTKGLQGDVVGTYYPLRLDANGKYTAGHGYLIPVKTGDKIQYSGLDSNTVAACYVDAVPVYGATVPLDGLSNAKNGLTTLFVVPSAYNSKYVFVYCLTLASIGTIYLNGQNILDYSDNYALVKEQAVKQYNKEYNFTPSYEMEIGSLSSNSVTTFARLKNHLPGRCIVRLNAGYNFGNVQVLSNFSRAVRNMSLPVRAKSLISRVMTFNYADFIRFTVYKDDGSAFTQEELSGIIASVKVLPYTTEKVSPSENKEYQLVTDDVADFIEDVTYDDNDYTYSAVATAIANGNFNVAPVERCVPVRLFWTPLDADVREYIVKVRTGSSIPGAYELSGRDNFFIPSERNYLDVYNLVPGKTYCYVVMAVLMDGTTIGIAYDTFTTRNDTVRIMNLPETTNVRDLGGWSVNGGTGTVKYGLVYRGAAMSRRQGYIINGEGREYACRFLNIAKEIGLGINYDHSPISETTAFEDIPVGAYLNGVTNSGANYVRALTEILETLTGSSSGELQPDETADGAVIFHCAGGADRTGTLSFLLLGLLGVSESDLAKEYELTSFEKGENRRTRNNNTQYVPMVEYIKGLTGATLKDKIEGWWLENGATAQQISTFRSMMIQ